MNSSKLKKEIANVPLLLKYFYKYGFSLGFWTLADGLCHRLKMQRAYEYSDKKRYDICKKQLRNKYGAIVEKYKKKCTNIPPEMITPDSNIWVFWWQGEENLPHPVNLCLQSIQQHAGRHPVVIISESNYTEYVDIPDYMTKKVKDGIITLAAFSDILRFELLYKYGGIWLDSTFYLTDSINSEVYNYSFYSISNTHGRKWVVTKDIWSISFLAMTSKHPIAEYMCEAFRVYWKQEDTIIAYLLVDCFMAIGYEDIPVFKEIINAIPENNTGVFDLLGPIRNHKCSKEEFDTLMGDTYVHKLTYKEKYLSENDNEKTFFGRLVEENAR